MPLVYRDYFHIDLTDEQQIDYIKNRYTGENIRLTTDVIEHNWQKSDQQCRMGFFPSSC